MKMLKAFSIELLVDIRHYPGSRHCPQFGKLRLKQNLKRHQIDYRHLENLGGRRKVEKNSSLNKGWRSAQFRAYADYMQTEDFKAAFKELLDLSKKQTVVIMCAEAVPWRCHRSLVGDALLINGYSVLDIFAHNKIKPHELTSFAKVKNKSITYPG